MEYPRGRTTAMEYPALANIALVDVLAALADPIRLEMVRTLAHTDERACNQFGLPVSKSTGSHHFRVLREAGLVEAREEGTRKYYRLRRAEVDERFPGLLDSVLSAARV